MSLASRAVINSKGLHVLVTGESGKGKSHAFESMMDLIPQEYCLSGRLTDKALFYQDNLRKGSIICLDDVSLSLSMQETLKGVTTSFKKPFIYRTVDKDRNSQTLAYLKRVQTGDASMGLDAAPVTVAFESQSGLMPGNERLFTRTSMRGL